MSISTLLHAHFLGSFKLVYGGTAVPLPTRSTAKILLAYLLLNRNKTHSRSQLAFLLAPDSSEERARRILSQALWQLRQSIPAPFIQTDGDHIRILSDAPLQIDTDDFIALTAPHLPNNNLSTVAADALQQAIILYRGDLLDDFYEDWVFLRREQLRETYLQTLWLLSAWEKENGRTQTALNHLQQLIQADPLRETAHREAMRCYALLGRPEAAIRQFELCRHILSKELQLEPEPATIQLRQEIIARREADTTAAAPSILKNANALPLIGREKERAAILHLIKNSVKQQGGIALIESPPGTGKTRLLQAVAQDASWRGFQVLWGNAAKTGPTVPYGAIVAALKTALTPLRAAQLREAVDAVWIDLVSQLLPPLAAPSPQNPPSQTTNPLIAQPSVAQASVAQASVAQAQHEQMRLLEALVRLLIGWSGFAPLLLVLEDVHEADSATFDLLALLAHRLANHRIVMLVSYRSDEARNAPPVWDGLQALAETAVSLRLTLADLPANSASQLIRAALDLDTAAPNFERRIFNAAGGNPLFILETLRALRDSGVLRRDEQGQWATDWDSVTVDYSEINMPERLDTIIHQRINQLQPNARLLLNYAVVLDGEFDLPLLDAISPLETRSALSAVSDLIRQRFFAELPAAYAFSHQTIRQAAYAALTPEERQEAHQRAARTLANLRPQAVESIAHHYKNAGQPAPAIHYYRQSAQNALQHFALTTARLHLDQALALADQADLPSEEQFALLAQREAITEVTGDSDTRRHDLAQMAQLAQDNPQQLAETERRYVHYHTNAAQPDFDQAVQHAQNALHYAQQMNNTDDGKAAIAAVHDAWGHALTIRGDMQQALSHFETALSLHCQLDDPEAQATLLLNYATALRMVARHHDALTAVQSALILREESGDKTAQVNALGELAVLHHEQGEAKNAIVYYRQALDLAREIGYRYREATVLVNWGNLLWFQGDFNQTLANYEAASIIFSELGNAHLEAQLRSNMASFLLNPFADFAAARRHAEWALTQSRQVNDLIGVGQTLALLGGIAQEEGDPAPAYRYFAEGMKALQQSAGTSYIFVMVSRERALQMLEQQQPQEALVLIDEALAICGESGMVDMAVSLTAVRGITLLHLNKPQEALAATRTAMKNLHDSVDQGYLIVWWHSQALAALGKKAAAAQALDEAYRLLQAYVAPLTAAQKQRSLTHLANHRAIVKEWQAGRRQVTVSLPCVDAPTGRPLRDDEYVEIQWTVESVGDTAVANKKERRQRQLLRLLHEAAIQNAAPTITHLAAALHVSPGTIKRDLAALRQAGHEAPTRGS